MQIDLHRYPCPNCQTEVLTDRACAPHDVPLCSLCKLRVGATAQKPTAVVKELPFRRPTLDTLRDELRDVLDQYAGRTTIAEAIGILELLKMDLIADARP